MAVASLVKYRRHVTGVDFLGPKAGLGRIVLVDFDAGGDVLAFDCVGEIKHGRGKSRENGSGPQGKENVEMHV